MAREAPARVDVYFEDFLAGMFDLSLEERGAYWTFCCLLWKHKGKLPDNNQMLARWCGCSGRLLRSVKARLIEKGKIAVDDGLIRQPRAENEWFASVSRLESAVNRGRMGGEKTAETRANSLNGHDPGSSSAPSSATPSASSHLHPHQQEEDSANHDKPESHEALAAPLSPASPAVVEARPEPLPDALSAVWKGLVAAGVPRSLIGRWCRDYGDGSVVEAYQSYRRAVTGGEKADARTYIIATLNRLVGTRGSDRSPMAIYQRTQARLDRADDGERDWNPRPINEDRVLALLAEMDPEGRA